MDAAPEVIVSARWKQGEGFIVKSSLLGRWSVNTSSSRIQYCSRVGRPAHEAAGQPSSPGHLEAQEHAARFVCLNIAGLELERVA